MKRFAVIIKRPCRICRKWFTPDPRLKERQKTCGRSDCKRQWHIRKCAEWNKKNSEYFRENYLSKKLSVVQESKDFKDAKINSPQKPRMNLKLPREYIQEVIGVQLLVIIDYLMQLLLRHVQEVIRV